MRNILLFLLALLTISVTAQKTNTFGFRIGAAIPKGNFAASDNLVDPFGFAKTGISVEASLNNWVSKSFSFVFAGKFVFNPVDKDKIFKLFQPSSPNVMADSDSKIGTWRTSNFLAGIETKSRLDDIFNFQIRLLIGAAVISSPPIYSSITKTGLLTQERGTAVGFVYSIGGKLNFKIDQMKIFGVGVEYINTKGNFEDVGVGNGSTFNFQQRVQVLLIEAGISFKIVRKEEK